MSSLLSSLDEIVTQLHQVRPLVEQEMQPAGPLTILEVEQRLRRREALAQRLDGILSRLRALCHGDGWPMLPKPDLMGWAQALLHHATSSFILEIDTSGVDPEAEILRLLLLRLEDGALVFDQRVRPTQSMAQRPEALTYNGLTAEELAGAPPLEEVWPAFCEQTQGRLLVSWGLRWDLAQLQRAGRRLQAPLPALGLDLQEPARAYFELSFASLGDICRRLGEPLPRPATAPARARGQLLVIRAMAEGRLGPLHEREQDEGDLDALDDLDDSQPF
ncbi:MAG: hypothetical protein IMW90_20220 [Thermogemmatispora sp.]|jgi:DNA polymerase III epsilon subunit-like protein|uniref:3'-5' exonuclease n=1 Tax=Thermogemmatispora sp. TaxID=1968838 RepID=UPI001A0933CF|nr:hypothetical protein [Thermogemmatispora sp.]MBE3568049.1 hypothetical protein [Thermogemmatispora sp.]